MGRWKTEWMAAALLAVVGLGLGLMGMTPAMAQQAAAPQSPVIVLTHPGNDAPYAWLDESGAARGAMVELWRRWGAREGFSVQFILAGPDECRELAISGRANAHAGDTQEPSLDKRMLFGEPILERADAMFVVEDSPIRSLADLQNTIDQRRRAQRPAFAVGVVGGTFAPQYMALVYSDCAVTEYDDAAAMLRSAERRGVEAVVCDIGAMEWLQAQGVVRERFRQVGGPDDVLYRRTVRPAVNLDNVWLLGRMNEGLRGYGGAAVLNDFVRAEPESPRPSPASRYMWPVIVALLGLAIMVLMGQTARARSETRKTRKELKSLREEHTERLKDLRRLTRDHKEAAEQLKFLSTHDSLTMLPTRRVLDLVFTQLAAQMSRHGRMMAVMHVDLDNFKKINDELGHAAGDAVLKLAAERLVALVRKSDLIVRLGGDEFIVVLTNLDKRAQAGEVADKILQKLGEQGRILGKSVRTHVSIGISFFPNDGKSLAELMQHADQAMCMVKDMGRNSWKMWNHDLGPSRRGTAEASSPAAAGSDGEWPVEEAVGVDDLFDEPEPPPPAEEPPSDEAGETPPMEEGETTAKVPISTAGSDAPDDPPDDAPAMPPAEDTAPDEIVTEKTPPARKSRKAKTDDTQATASGDASSSAAPEDEKKPAARKKSRRKKRK